MTLQWVGQTTNFIYYYQDSLSDPAVAKQRAQYFLSSNFCETDLAQLEPWFGVTGGFGPNNRIQVHIDRSNSLGSNGGYQPGGYTTIQVAPFDGTSTGEPITTSEAQCRALLVAELAEVLMDYRNQQTGVTTWQARNSMGEGLSLVCEALLHPEGYYAPAPANIGPRIGKWLNASPRPNWVDSVEATDQDVLSYGCGIAFIYFLKSQLGFSMNQIITLAGTNFAETFHNLTGGPGAWDSFIGLLNSQFPPGKMFKPTSDDLFPIPVGMLKGLTLFPGTVTGGGSSIGTVTLQAPVAAPTIVSLSVVDSTHGPVPVPGGGSGGGTSTPAVTLSAPSVTVKAGKPSATFKIDTTASASSPSKQTATITATAVFSKYAMLTVEN